MTSWNMLGLAADLGWDSRKPRAMSPDEFEGALQGGVS